MDEKYYIDKYMLSIYNHVRWKFKMNFKNHLSIEAFFRMYALLIIKSIESIYALYKFNI